MDAEARAKEHEHLASIHSGRTGYDHAKAALKIYVDINNKAQGAPEKTRIRIAFDRAMSLAQRLKRELDVIDESSNLHGNVFRPWPGPPDPLTFQDPFIDPAVFSLSRSQREILGGWKRPCHIFPEGSQFMTARYESDLVQDVTTDCSVVASLCCIMRVFVSGNTSVLCDAMYPFPLASPSGKYLFKMYFNGCAREVVIDDRLPVSSTGRHLFAVDRRNPTLIWPALMEKAYLKVRGGYDFPGSNSSTDLFILTGWIPEQLLLRDPELTLDKTWNRVKPFHEKGVVMFTLGTRSLSQTEEEVIGLVGDHDYAVLRMDDSTGDRKLLIKNPWKDCTTWKGVGATGSSAIPDRNPPVPGAFWMSLDDLVQNFEFAYLNWSPKLFAHRIDRHFQWQMSDNTHISSHVLSPQFCILPTTEGTIWILLSRHFADGELPIMQNCSNKSLAEVSKGLGFISLYIFLADGKRVEVDDHPLYSGSFLDSPQVLARIHVRPREPYTVVICQDCLPLPEYSFTLSVLSQGPICVEEASERMTHYKSKRDSWTRTTAGGNLKSSRYPENPQYCLCLPAVSPLTILLQCSNPEIPVHVGISWGGSRVFCPKRRDMVGGSDKYRRGATMANLTTVGAGEYTIVCSTFEPNTFANFTLRVGAMASFTLRDIPAEHAGRRITRAPDLVFHEGERRKRCPLNIQRLTKFFARAAAPDKLPSLGIRLSLEVGQGFDSKHLAVSEDEEFGYESCGVRTPEIDLNPAAHGSLGIWLSVEIAGSFSCLRQVDVQVLTETGIYIGPWQVVESY